MHDKKLPPVSLKRRGDFSCVFSKGRHVASALLVLYKRANGLDYPRLGLSVGRKVGGAVVRNRIKRVLREAVRTRRSLQGGYDYIILARPGAGRLKKPEGSRILLEDLRKLFARIRP